MANPRPEDKALYHQAVKDQEALLAGKPDLPENRVKLSQYLNNLANLEARTDPARAEREYRKILDLLAGLDRTRVPCRAPGGKSHALPTTWARSWPIRNRRARAPRHF